MTIHQLINIIFYLTAAAAGLFTISGIYALLRFGKSKILGLSISIFYIILMWGLFISGVVSLNKIPFDNF